jgi:phage repressor protein C with HTH and peptisase S24 domain
MLSHTRIWAFIDQLAEESSLSISGLAKKAGLDPTTFNKSKRTNVGGRLRWPSTESLAKVMEVTELNTDDFIKMMVPHDKIIDRTNQDHKDKISLPFINFTNAKKEDCFEENGLPSGKHWHEMQYPALTTQGIFAFEVDTSTMAPFFKEGDILIIDRHAQLRKGDRIVFRTLNGDLMGKILAHQTDKVLELQSLDQDQKNMTLTISDIDWIGRVMWVSQ